MYSSQIYDYTIIGAGLTGLSLGWDLVKNFPHLKIQILEKSKSCGGRMATRRINETRFDHGAQFILREGFASRWIDLWSEQKVLAKFPCDSFEAFCGINGMTQLPKILAKDLDVKYNFKVSQLRNSNETWILHDELGQEFQSKSVVMTSPLPQTLALLESSGLGYDPLLSNLQYSSALVVLIESTGFVNPQVNYQESVDENIHSICNQQAKGNSVSPSWVVVMTHHWSQKNFEEEENQVLKEACQLIQLKWPQLHIDQAYLKKWKFCFPLHTWPKLFENPAAGLYLAGDAFGGPNLIGALKSSQGLFKALTEQINHF